MQFHESYATSPLKRERGEKEWDVIWTISSYLNGMLFWWKYEFWEHGEKQEAFMGVLQLW